MAFTINVIAAHAINQLQIRLHQHLDEHRKAAQLHLKSPIATGFC